MKKVLLFIAAAALTLSSCVKEQFAGVDGNMETVSFGLALDNGVQTRADGDAPIADKLYYAVFDENDALIAEFKATSQNVTEYPASVDIRLTKGQTYTVAFWAQNSKTDAYTVSDDLKITVNYNKANNDVKRDAFFGKETFTVGESSNNHEVTLTRPFAQLNVGITDEDLEAAAKTGVVIANSAVKVSGIADSFDVFTGTATGSVDAVYTLGKVPTAALTVGTDVYNWLSMSYLLIDSKTTSTIELTFDPADQSKTDITIREGLANIPLQRNWRTNIVGNLLTGNVHFEISLLENFADGYDMNYEDLVNGAPVDEEDFKAVVSRGGVVKVNKEMETIDFNELAIEDDLTLIIESEVSEVKLGGNVPAVVARSASELPNITILVVKDVPYPTITFNKNAENYTILGDLKTTEPFDKVVALDNTAKNITFSNIKATGDARIESSAQGMTIQNCVAADLNGSFINLVNASDVKILNNAISFAASVAPVETYANAIEMTYFSGDVLIEGNTISKAAKHGIFAKVPQGYGTLTIKNNSISGVGEDGIKTDGLTKIVVTGNTIDAADYGVRFDRINASRCPADYVISNNTITTDGFEKDETTPTTAIRVRYRDFANDGAITVNLTAKDNKAGVAGIPAGKYVDFTSEGMTLTGDYENPFEGCLKAGGRYYASLSDAIAAGDTDILLPAGEWTLSNGGNNLKITGVSTDAKVILAGGDLRWKTAELNNVTIISPATGDNPAGGLISTEGTTVHNNCVIENVYFCLGTKTEFNGCTFNMTNPNAYNVWTYGSNASFSNCEFYSAGKAALVYAHGGDGTYKKTNFKDCKFYASSPAKNKAAIEIDSSLCPFDVNIENCTSEGFDLGSVSKNTLYNLKNGTLGVNCIITVDGFQYLSDGFAYDAANNAYNILNANGLRYFASQVNAKIAFKNTMVKLTDNIDLTGQDWTPINGWEGILNGTTIDGQGYTISNMSVNGGDSAGFISNNASSVTVKNVTFDNAAVTTATGNQKYAGVVIGKSYSHVTLEKVNVTNSAVVCTWQCGGLVGFAETNAPVFVNCSISDSFVGGSNATAGAFFGLGRVDITATGCKAANVNLYTDGLTWNSTQKSVGNFLVGHIYGKTLTAADYEESGVKVVSEYPAGL